MKKKILMFCIIFILSIGFLAVKKAEAGSGDNVYGWAWSENIGWISFNNTTGGGSVNYGININSSTGLFSGYAWSENIGWISFNSAELTGCPSGTCEANLNLGTNQVSGWARACVVFPEDSCSGTLRPDSERGGWDGWIKLRGTWLNGVSLNTAPTPKEFRGWAWGSDVVGWISFNCENCENNTNCDKQATCDGTHKDYKVMTDVNPAPSANNLNVEEGNYCNCGPTQITKCSGSRSEPPIFLNWTFNDLGDTQSAYQVEIHRNSNYTSLAIPSNKATSFSGIYAPLGLSFNTQYWWRLKVWDSATPAQESAWILYNDILDPDGDGNPATFTTDAHRWPNTDFTPNPLNPPAGVEVTFIDNSKCYTAAGGEYDCENGVATSYKWDFDYDPEEGFTVDSTAKGVNPTRTYTVSGNYIVRLEVTDSMCPAVFPLKVSLPLPTWKEIAPF